MPYVKKGDKLPESTKRKISLNNARYWLGKKRSKETIEKVSKTLTGKYVGDKSCHFNNGFSFFKGKKRWIVVCRDKTKVPYSRIVMEDYLGRSLTKDEVVHHINETKDDDRIENLQLTTLSKHTSFHHSGSKNTNSKLTEKYIKEIRDMNNKGVSSLEIAEKFGVSYRNIVYIIKKQAWKQVK